MGHLGPILVALLKPLSDILPELPWEFQQSPVATIQGDIGQLRERTRLDGGQYPLLSADDISLVPKEKRWDIHNLVIGVWLLALVAEYVALVPYLEVTSASHAYFEEYLSFGAYNAEP